MLPIFPHILRFFSYAIIFSFIYYRLIFFRWLPFRRCHIFSFALSAAALARPATPAFFRHTPGLLASLCGYDIFASVASITLRCCRQRRAGARHCLLFRCCHALC